MWQTIRHPQPLKVVNLATISLFSKKYTIGDNAAVLEGTNTFIEDADFLILNNDVYLGNGNTQTLLMEAGTTLNKRLINLREVFAKNKTPGSTGYIVVFGNLVTGV